MLKHKSPASQNLRALVICHIMFVFCVIAYVLFNACTCLASVTFLKILSSLKAHLSIYGLSFVSLHEYVFLQKPVIAN